MLSSSVWRGMSHWWFSLGLLCGALAMAAGLVTVGAVSVQAVLPRYALEIVIGALVPMCLLQESGVLRLRLPQNARQVPQTIVARGADLGALQFGFEMGTGVRTYVTSSLPHVLALSLLLLGGPVEAMAAGLGFGSGRSLMMLSSRLDSEEERWNSRFERHGRSIRLCLAVVGLAAFLGATGAVNRL